VEGVARALVAAVLVEVVGDAAAQPTSTCSLDVRVLPSATTKRAGALGMGSMIELMRPSTAVSFRRAVADGKRPPFPGEPLERMAQRRGQGDGSSLTSPGSALRSAASSPLDRLHRGVDKPNTARMQPGGAIARHARFSGGAHFRAWTSFAPPGWPRPRMSRV
jgi:hypothetical protein